MLDQSIEAINEFPAAIILTDPIDYTVGLGGNTFRGTLRVVLLVQHANSIEAWQDLDNYLNPIGSLSIRAAIQADRTLGGNVDDAWCDRVERIQHRDMFGGHYAGADFLVRYVRSV